MSLSNTPTAHAVSPDSGEHWTAEGAWQVAPGLWRIPLPLPMDGLKAVNVYVLETDAGLTLVDGGWAIPVARELLENWGNTLSRFVKVMPRDYRRALLAMKEDDDVAGIAAAE